MRNSEVLWGYVFKFNPYQELWYAIKNEDLSEFMAEGSSKDNPKFLKSRDMSDLVKYLTKPKEETV